MNYNDFPILNPQEYKHIQEQYNSLNKPRIAYSEDLLISISQCIDLCNSENSPKLDLKKELEVSKKSLIQIQENLLANFSLKKSSSIKFYEFNIFSLLNKILNCLKITNLWFQTEEKIYYKTFIKKTNFTLINILQKITTILEKINVKIFKHM